MMRVVPDSRMQHKLGVARDPCGKIARQRQRLVERIGVQRLRAALRRRHRLDAGAHHVVEHVLRGERPARGLGVRAQHQRALRLRLERLHQLRPQHARGALLRHLHEEVHAGVPEERQPRRKVVDVEPGGKAGAHIFDAVGERIGELEIAGRARLLHVIAGDRDRIEFRHVLRRIGEDVGNDAHRGLGRIDVGVAHHEFFEDVVLDGAAELLRRHALLFGGDDIERQHRQHRAIHGHRHASSGRAGCRRTASSCRGRNRSRRPPCRHRRRRADGRSHSRDGSADRRRPTGPSGRRRDCAGRRRWNPPPSRSRHIAGWSRAG